MKHNLLYQMVRAEIEMKELGWVTDAMKVDRDDPRIIKYIFTMKRLKDSNLCEIIVSHLSSLCATPKIYLTLNKGKISIEFQDWDRIEDGRLTAFMCTLV